MTTDAPIDGSALPAGDRVSGAEALLCVLEAWGVDHVFICPGSTEAAFLDASHDHPGIRFVLTTHESVAVAMADGHARATGRPAVAYLHANVGLANGIGHLYAAELARSPVLLLTGIKPRPLQNRRGFTTTPHMRDYVRQHVKSEWQVLSAGAVAEDAVRALKVAMAEPPGPTWLGVAQDLLEAEVAPPPSSVDRFRFAARTRPDARVLDEAAALLAGAARPLIVAGAELARVGAVSDVVALAERLGAPAVGEDRRTFERSAYPSQHRCSAGLYSSKRACLQTADVVLLAGARSTVAFEPTSSGGMPPAAQVVHLHPDPHEIGRVEGVDVPLVGDAGLGVRDLFDLLRDHRAHASATRFVADARREHTLLSPRPVEDPPLDCPPIRVSQLMRELAACVDEGTTVVGDATTSGGALLEAMPMRHADAFHTTSSGSLGWGMGAALGLALGNPSRRVLAVVGDGVLQFGIQALWTAAHYRIPATFVVVNNRSYAAVGAALRRYGGPAFREGRTFGVDISGPDLAAVAAGFGLSSARIHELSQVRGVVDGFLRNREPGLIEILTDPQDLGP
ncbi:MAG: hypothetical protein GEU81_07440 [Nitriliruptorales bacterium]|nr:hypothetical protein [Nitriliruptorales bacterium]